MCQLVSCIASHFELIAAERKISFTLNLPGSGDVPARVDEDKVQRMLLNLLSNAFKFTPVGMLREATVLVNV